jgi:outer membrane autotransporter protein
MVGYNRGEVDFDQSLNTANLEGVHSGVYGGVTMGAFYLDAVLNSAWLTLDSDAPILNLFPAGTMASTTVVSLGAQAEAGWRFALGPAAITPLASVSYVSSTVEDLNVPSADPSRIGGDVVFEDARSLRAGLGARVSMTDVMSQVAPVSLSLTARAMQESEGMADADIHNVGPFAAPVSDVLDGMFSEVVGVVAITNQSRTAAGVLNLGGVFGDDYRSVSASVGLRYQW